MKKLSFNDFYGRSKKCRGPARAIFKTKYNDYVFGVIGAFVDNETEAIVENMEATTIIVKNVNVVKNILDTFDGLIRILAINFENIQTSEGYEIVKHLNSKQLHSFLMLGLWNSKGNVLDEWKNAFPNVINFGFSSSKKTSLEIKNDNPKLWQLLPKLENFELDCTQVSDWKLIGNQFPKLNTFKVKLPQSRNQNQPNEGPVVSLLTNSKQIEYLTIVDTNLGLLKGVGDNLAEIKNLTISSLSESYSDDKIEPFELNNVKYLKIESKIDAIPEKVAFYELDGITLNIQFTNKWAKFFSKQIKTVEDFTLASNKLSNEDLLKIAQHLPFLKTVDISTQSAFQANDIFVFVGHNNKLKSLVLNAKMKEDERNTIVDLFQPKYWNVTVTQLDSDQSVRINIIK